jgi:nucleotide-binding universal stress UspA family protein
MSTQRSIAFREILAATDFSRQSGQAFEAALALAQHFGAHLHTVHVVSDASEKRTAQEKLDAFLRERIEGIEIAKAVLVGQAAHEVVNYAEREEIDLIVLGTRGRTGLARVLMGSVAEAVVRTAPCQVLTIGPKAERAERAAPPLAAATIPESHCLVCAKPSRQTICDLCKAYIQGEAIERKRREEQAGRRGLSI